MFLNNTFLLVFISVLISVKSFRTVREDDEIQLFVKSNERFTLACDVENSIDLCGFTHPNGAQVLLTEVIPGTPYCSIELTADHNTGLWTCFTRSHTSKLIISQHINVRKADKMAAVRPIVTADEGDRVSLSCVTTEEMVPLDGCVFRTPRGEVLAVFSDGLRTLEDKGVSYSMSPNKSVDRGDCSVTVESAGPELEGTWHCSGELRGHLYSDTIRVTINRRQNLDRIQDHLKLYVSGSIIVIISLVLFAVFVYKLVRKRTKDDFLLSNKANFWEKFDSEFGKTNKDIFLQ